MCCASWLHTCRRRSGGRCCVRRWASRVRVLSALALRLPEERRAVLGEALGVARAIGDEESRVQALSELASDLPGELLDEALTVARTVGDEESRVGVLSALALRLPSSEERRAVLGEALGVARAIGDEESRVQALSELASDLP